jgi:hypothetical protein
LYINPISKRKGPILPSEVVRALRNLTTLIIYCSIIICKDGAKADKNKSIESKKNQISYENFLSSHLTGSQQESLDPLSIDNANTHNLNIPKSPFQLQISTILTAGKTIHVDLIMGYQIVILL